MWYVKENLVYIFDILSKICDLSIKTTFLRRNMLF
tara:strand:+ start:1094 stop:1198 length:105 start_codon:yes stop_codon:yes gene_type:complete